jgi:hypothetical protein
LLILTFYPMKITNAQIVLLARMFGYNPAAVASVLEVEAPKGGFLQDGRLTILFERHWFYKLTPEKVSKVRPDLSNPQPGGYKGGDAEWDRLNAAIAFDEINALKSASWGKPQIMGFNHALCGYGTVKDMIEDFKRGEYNQVKAMLQLIKNQPSWDRALKSQNWKRFAELYNGPNQDRGDLDPKNDYEYLLKQAFTKFNTPTFLALA